MRNYLCGIDECNVEIKSEIIMPNIVVFLSLKLINFLKRTFYKGMKLLVIYKCVEFKSNVLNLTL